MIKIELSHKEIEQICKGLEWLEDVNERLLKEDKEKDIKNEGCEIALKIIKNIYKKFS